MKRKTIASAGLRLLLGIILSLDVSLSRETPELEEAIARPAPTQRPVATPHGPALLPPAPPATASTPEEEEHPAALIGRVLEAGGRGVANAHVIALPVNAAVNGPLIGTTDSNGQYAVSLPPGDYSVYAVSLKHQPTKPIDFAILPQQDAFQDFILEAGLALRGRVVDERGQPVAGEVRARSSLPDEAKPSAQSWRSAKCAPDGSFELTGLDPGTYLLSATHEDLGHDPVVVEAPANDLRLQMFIGGILSGKVVSGRREQTPRAVRVSLASDDDNASAATRWGARKNRLTGHDGRFEFKGLKDGLYTVTASSAAGARAEARVRVQAGRAPWTELTLGGDRNISGTVLDGRGRQLPRAWVKAAQVTSSGLAAQAQVITRSNDDGAFVLSDVVDGTYEVRASKEGYLEDARSEATARAGDHGVTLVLQSGGALLGRVLDDSGRPVLRFQVNGERVESGDGAFRVSLRRRGKQQVLVSANGFAHALRYVQPDDGADVSLGDVRLSKGRRMTGQVVDATTGTPIVDATILIGLADHPTPGRPSRDALFVRTNATGAFEVQLEHESVSARVQASGYEPTTLRLDAQQGSVVVPLKRLTL